MIILQNTEVALADGSTVSNLLVIDKVWHTYNITRDRLIDSQPWMGILTTGFMSIGQSADGNNWSCSRIEKNCCKADYSYTIHTLSTYNYHHHIQCKPILFYRMA